MKILIVEDEKVSALVLRRTLQKLGHEVTLAEDGACAWQRLLTEEYRLVISDWMMPEVDGLELCRRMRQNQSEGYTYFILLTAKDNREDRLIGMAAGADDFLIKPMDEQELVARLQVAQRILTMQEELRERSLQLANTLQEMESAHRLVRKMNQALESEHQALTNANRKLQALASADSMTGLANHRTFQEQLRNEVARAVRHDVPLTVLMLDVDHFKKYNDSHGHPAGDEVLKSVARLLKETLRTEDFTARYGGEEFAAILPLTVLESAQTFAERFRSAVASYDFPNQQVTVSIGLAEYLSGEDTPESLITKADHALYAAKHSGRNRVFLATDLPFIKDEPKASLSVLTEGEGFASSRMSNRWGNLEGLLQEPVEHILAGVLSILETRQAESQGHSQRVVQIALRLGQEVAEREVAQIDPGVMREIALGSLLHDIGKTTVSPEILHKTSPLTAEEQKELRNYPMMGIELLENFPMLAPGLAIIRHQHERWDGGGYPDALAGEAIPLAARIFSIANAFDTMCHVRPYRSAQSYEEAQEEIIRYSGSQFDPNIVRAFIGIPLSEWDALLHGDTPQTLDDYLPKAA